jgi:hypothetical protein
MSKDHVVIYHGDCIDGFTAAWVCWTQVGDEATYIGAKFGEPPPDVTGKHVYIVDFSYKRQQLIEMYEAAATLLVIDHHQTAESDLQGLGFCLFDMERSGAGLAWDYFHPNKKRPWLINYVEDRDLWNWELDDSRAVNAYISTVEHTFGNWTKMSMLGIQEAVHQGQGIVNYIDRYVNSMKEHARIIEFEGYMVPCVNAPYINISELVGTLAETECSRCGGLGTMPSVGEYAKDPRRRKTTNCNNCHGTGSALFALGWFQRGDGLYAYSLRSRGEFDVSVLAARYGGGGHKNSAGFVRGERI